MGNQTKIGHTLSGNSTAVGGNRRCTGPWPRNGLIHTPALAGPLLVVVGTVAGFCIGIVAALLGVAGGELLIPTLVLLFAADMKLAGSLSLAVSLPTMIVGFTRYSRDRSFAVLGRNKTFVLIMAAGSIVGTFIGGQLLGVVPEGVLLPTLAVILIISAVKIWHH